MRKGSQKEGDREQKVGGQEQDQGSGKLSDPVLSSHSKL